MMKRFDAQNIPAFDIDLQIVRNTVTLQNALEPNRWNFHNFMRCSAPNIPLRVTRIERSPVRFFWKQVERNHSVLLRNCQWHDFEQPRFDVISELHAVIDHELG